MTKHAPTIEFDALLMKLQRALRGASDADAASALISLLFHRLTMLDGRNKAQTLQALAIVLDMQTRLKIEAPAEIVLAEGPRRAKQLRVTH